jgi:uncharacterized membrane protein YhhN
MPTSRVIIVLYAFAATVNVMASTAGQSSLDWATKPLLMPLLAGVVVFAAHEAGRRPSRTLLAALGGATAGDVALMADGTLPFLIGMAAFLGCQVLLIISFVRAGSRPRLWISLLYFTGYAVAVPVLWSGLGGLALPVSLYAAALTAMAVLAAGLGWRIGLGGLLFFASDLLLAVGLADVVHLSGPWVMLTYVVGLALIVTGWIARPAPPEIPHPRPALEDAAAHT